MRSSLAAGAKRDATTVTSRPQPRPDQARAWPRLPALAHTTACEPLPASRLATTAEPLGSEQCRGASAARHSSVAPSALFHLAHGALGVAALIDIQRRPASQI